VLALPRARLAITRLANVVDPSRESPSYSHRCWKYSLRGFAVAVPGYSGAMNTAELAKPKFEAGGLALLIQLDEKAREECHHSGTAACLRWLLGWQMGGLTLAVARLLLHKGD